MEIVFTYLIKRPKKSLHEFNPLLIFQSKDALSLERLYFLGKNAQKTKKIMYKTKKIREIAINLLQHYQLKYTIYINNVFFLLI